MMEAIFAGFVLLLAVQDKPAIPIPPEAEAVVIVVRAGKDKAGAGVDLVWDDRSSTRIPIKASDDDFVEDCYLQFPWGLRLYTRPNPRFYRFEKKEDRDRAVERWRSLPAASQHPVRIEVRRAAGGARVWLDGRFVQELAGKNRVTEVRLSSGEVRWTKEAAGRYLPIPLEDYARPGNWAGARVTPGAGETLLEGVPFKVASSAGSLQVAGLGRMSCPSDDLVSYYWRRCSLDGLPESCIISVPLDTYAFAHVLCAAEEDPLKVPAFTLRLTRYGGSRGDAMADTVVRLPGTGARTVGRVEAGGKTVPLWYVRVPLKSGMIQDLRCEDDSRRQGVRLGTWRSLDLEVMDPLGGVDEYDAFPPPMRHVPRDFSPRGPDTSSVHVFAITLEASPASLEVRTGAPAYAFYASDRPTLRAAVKGREAGEYEVDWDFADVEGKVAASGKKSLSLSGEDLEAAVEVPVDVPVGWYAARFRLRRPGGPDLVDYRGSFAMLPPDTRQAGFESPHGTWWFHWAHGGEPDIRRVGPVLQRAGLRHTVLPRELPESVTSEYKVTAWCVTWKEAKAKELEPWLREHEEHIRETLRLWPSLKSLMVLHEAGAYGAPFPPELWGEKPVAPLAAKDEESWKYRMDRLTAFARMAREKFPALRIQIGNAGDGCALVGEMLRRGWPAELYDDVAVEDLGQTFIPEKPVPGGMQSAWLLRQVARKFGHGHARVTAAYEWVGRRNTALGLGAQAEWYVRDALQARAYGFDKIALGTVFDAGNGYFHTIWGNGGLCFRYPYMQPKPSYVALATLTRVLDGARFERLAPTGSLSLYAPEFRRGDEWVYALWVPRGRREARLRFEGEADLRVTDLYGRERSSRGRDLDLGVSTGAQYVAAKARLSQVTAGKSSFPEDGDPAGAVVVDRMEDPGAWEFQDLKWLENAKGGNLPHRKQGKVEMRGVEDPEKGKCIELELKPEGALAWELMHEFASIRLKEPKGSPGTCRSVGVWVKGNSGWGDVLFEVLDASGKGRLLHNDWPGTTSINFDGWRLVRAKLPEGKNWAGPVKLKGLVVTFPRQALYVTEMAPVPDLRVRLKDACFP